ncbi:hypothetical protein E5K00_04870 [Hymenobacter aquaticus]|uniref:DUF3298 domain-containing protein n=1 Tax=Hymenobacter aquaticus TaxID=1867101 RepID=A0A4Z0Q392_9BACT|nr:hypothetical protein [Hymenobacter aquaticus]TGE24548.1 hypothetical protein E5K00_04870 [Hymenobacter aquaticus]
MSWRRLALLLVLTGGGARAQTLAVPAADSLATDTLAATAPADTVVTQDPPSRLYHEVFAGPRRLRGTVGTQGISLELDSVGEGYVGGYYYDRQGRWLEVRLAATRPAGPALLCETPTGDLTGQLGLPARVATPFKGSWESAEGRLRLPVKLRETYADAARYQHDQWEGWRYSTRRQGQIIPLDSAFFHQQYLVVQLPQRPVAEQRLRRALAAPVAPARMPAYLDSVLRARQEEHNGYQFHAFSDVVYNANNVLSVVQVTTVQQGPDYQPHEWYEGRAYDLRTGRRLRLPDLLLPGYQKRLPLLFQQALRRYLADQPAYGPIGGAAPKLPTGGFALTPRGLVLTYDDRDDAALAQPGPGHPDRALEIVLTYEELLPLIRRTGPLVPVLRERGLLPKK